VLKQSRGDGLETVGTWWIFF